METNITSYFYSSALKCQPLHENFGRPIFVQVDPLQICSQLLCDPQVQGVFLKAIQWSSWYFRHLTLNADIFSLISSSFFLQSQSTLCKVNENLHSEIRPSDLARVLIGKGAFGSVCQIRLSHDRINHMKFLSQSIKVYTTGLQKICLNFATSQLLRTRRIVKNISNRFY